MSFVEARCPNCNGILAVDRENDAAICQYCGTPFIVEKAIQQYKIDNVNNINTDVVNVYGNVGENSHSAWFEKGRSYFEIERWEDAKNCFVEAYRLNPASAKYALYAENLKYSSYNYHGLGYWLISFHDYKAKFPDWEKELEGDEKIIILLSHCLSALRVNSDWSRFRNDIIGEFPFVDKGFKQYEKAWIDKVYQKKDVHTKNCISFYFYYFLFYHQDVERCKYVVDKGCNPFIEHGYIGDYCPGAYMDNIGFKSPFDVLTYNFYRSDMMRNEYLKFFDIIIELDVSHSAEEIALCFDYLYLGEIPTKKNWKKLYSINCVDKSRCQMILDNYDLPVDVVNEPNVVRRAIKNNKCPLCRPYLSRLFTDHSNMALKGIGKKCIHCGTSFASAYIL